MKESTGLPALTIHRLLGWTGGATYTHDEDNPVQGRLLVVDEMSMVDIWLANQLLKSLPDDIKMVIVGDEDQLPSVGPGQVLSDLIQSGVVPVVRLTEIFRQAEGSSIIELAHQIKEGKIGDITEPRPDRRFIRCGQSQVVAAVCQIAAGAVKKGYTAKDIQVLAPIYRGNAGIDKINEALQDQFNPQTDQKRSLQMGDHVFACTIRCCNWSIIPTIMSITAISVKLPLFYARRKPTSMKIQSSFPSTVPKSVI